MKKILAIVLAVFSGLYLLLMGPVLDPLPFLDEGLALLVLVNCLSYLGFDLRGLRGGSRKSLRAKGGDIRVD